MTEENNKDRLRRLLKELPGDDNERAAREKSLQQKTEEEAGELADKIEELIDGSEERMARLRELHKKAFPTK